MERSSNKRKKLANTSEAIEPRTRPSSSGYLVESTFETALDDLKSNGYCWIPKAIPSRLCKPTAKAIQSDIGQRLDNGSVHQEEPIEHLKESTGKWLLKIREYILTEILLNKLGVDAKVPDEWSETLYGRVKRKHFLTRWHCDAFNTLFERGLLEPTNLPDGVKPSKQWSKIRKTGVVSCEWDDIPIFTFWVALRPVSQGECSHLRLLPGSHKMPSKALREDLRNVIPEGFQYDKKDFIGPPFPGGYGVGDIVIFHCFTQHEANAHTIKTDTDHDAERISMDGRFFLQL